MLSPVMRMFPQVFVIRTWIGYKCQWTVHFFVGTANQQLVCQLPIVAVYDNPEVAGDGCESTIQRSLCINISRSPSAL